LLVASLLQGSSTPRLLEKGTMSFVDSPKEVVARTAAEFEAFWKLHAPARQQPRVDFDAEMVAGVFVGSRSTAGYSLEFVGVEDRPDALVVRYREIVPARDAILAQIVTSPYFLMAVPRRAGAVRFEKVQ
jgi:hypothetical protein